ncbi:hypothetical protein [Frigidibacter mobilis]|uniref:hypothetical protein n=1 Tax=Frigidibacter mobilis TaxID=1335048 RepID=UPI0014131423|nr:hypothetical protein [Frigidibacter mobilis]
MPDTGLAEGFLATARTLLPEDPSICDQASLRRAISSSYYALFHALARAFANAIVGEDEGRPRKAWVEVYRGVDHGACKEACKKASEVDFPQPIQHVADAFQQLMLARQSADYDPVERFDAAGTLQYVSLAESAIAALQEAEKPDIVAFAAWVLITSRGSKEARAKVRPSARRAGHNGERSVAD